MLSLKDNNSCGIVKLTQAALTEADTVSRRKTSIIKIKLLQAKNECSGTGIAKNMVTKTGNEKRIETERR